MGGVSPYGCQHPSVHQLLSGVQGRASSLIQLVKSPPVPVCAASPTPQQSCDLTYLIFQYHRCGKLNTKKGTYVVCQCEFLVDGANQ